MKSSSFRALTAPSLALFLVGCAGDPLAARWVSTNAGSDRVTTVTLDLQSGGAATASVTIAGGSCSGTISYAGATWSSTATDITFTGTVSCSGAVTCATRSSLTCGTETRHLAGVQPYFLANSNNTLIIQSTSYTRSS